MTTKAVSCAQVLAATLTSLATSGYILDLVGSSVAQPVGYFIRKLRLLAPNLIRSLDLSAKLVVSSRLC